MLTFAGDKDVVIQARIGLSTVDVAGAGRNLKTEIPGWDFESVKSGAQAKWRDYLACLAIEGTPRQKETFYTALYHTAVVPNNIADVDGWYRGADNKVYVAKDKAYYSTFSLWDTHRALNPLYTILWPERVEEMVRTMLAHYEVQGYLPMWTLWGHENHCMIGQPCHSGHRGRLPEGAVRRLRAAGL